MNTFKPTYLYVKTHNTTGLKYFGKTTSKDPYKYKGSGTHWKRHINKHGNDVTTEIIGLFTDKIWCEFYAHEFSNINNITESTSWANLKPENGADGGDTLTHNKNIEQIKKNFRSSRKGNRWWTDGKSQIFTKVAPTKEWYIGRIPFNNVGAAIGTEISRNKIWVTNGISDIFIDKNDPIPTGFLIGRSTAFSVGRHNCKGTSWWNNGVVSKMSIERPDDTFVKGRLTKPRKS